MGQLNTYNPIYCNENITLLMGIHWSPVEIPDGNEESGSNILMEKHARWVSFVA